MVRSRGNDRQSRESLLKRLTDEEIATIVAAYREAYGVLPIRVIGRTLTDLRRYKAALEEVARRPCQHGAVLSAPCSHAESPVSMCPPCIARRALADDEEGEA